jgi:hypothetical protein
MVVLSKSEQHGSNIRFALSANRDVAIANQHRAQHWELDVLTRTGRV